MGIDQTRLKIQELYGTNGELLGVFIPGEQWNRVKQEVGQFLDQGHAAEQAPGGQVGEPLQDWETLKKFWDFPYPVDLDVNCPDCGLRTVNWQEDEPRKFLLKAANLGGLVVFRCQGCGARIIKRHFKDKIQVETQSAAKR